MTLDRRPTTDDHSADFVICPHCWQVNPLSRFCAKCLADMTLLLQESGGRRWTAPAQSPIPVRVGERLAPWQRWVLFGAVVLFGIGQLALAFSPGAPGAAPSGAEGTRPTTED